MEYATKNPVAAIKKEIEMPVTTPSILTPAQAADFMTKAKEHYPALVPHIGISLFAGLRPEEVALLQWEQIDDEHITVLPETTKVKKKRHVPIEANLAAWLESFKGKRSGLVANVPNLLKSLQGLRVKMGYKIGKNNPEAETWKEDTMRHSYATYWLAKYKKEESLAVNMGNSIQVIKKHYLNAAKPAVAKLYWSILPDGANTEIVKTVTQEELKAAKVRGFAKALA